MDIATIQVLMCTAATVLMGWGTFVSYMFYVMTTCEKLQGCPKASVCRKPTDDLQLRTLIVSTTSLFTISIMGTVFNFPMSVFIVLCSFYATYLLYATIDLYFWRRSTKQCFVRRSSVVQWLPK